MERGLRGIRGFHAKMVPKICSARCRVCNTTLGRAQLGPAGRAGGHLYFKQTLLTNTLRDRLPSSRPEACDLHADLRREAFVPPRAIGRRTCMAGVELAISARRRNLGAGLAVPGGGRRRRLRPDTRARAAVDRRQSKAAASRFPAGDAAAMLTRPRVRCHSGHMYLPQGDKPERRAKRAKVHGRAKRVSNAQ